MAEREYTPVIGLEIHAQLLTESKIFSSDPAGYGAPPNTHISPVSLGYPGTLPVLNRDVLEMAIKMGIVCNCKISREIYFDRKNYFYPDLPKGYQITQDKTPVCREGYLWIQSSAGEKYKIGIQKIHLEEDAGKSIHDKDPDYTLVDFNRAGVPLIEIVTEPEIHSAQQAYDFLIELRKLVRYLKICDGNMEQGSLRCDANISIMSSGEDTYGNKVEIKNLNSIKFVRSALKEEIRRQTALIKKGEKIVSETRHYDEKTDSTKSMRKKETLSDYRYFPEPDLRPVIISEKWIGHIKSELPLLPDQYFDKLTKKYGLSEYQARVLVDEGMDMIRYFEEICKVSEFLIPAANWLLGPVKNYLNEKNINISSFPIEPGIIASIIELVESGKVSFSIASQKLFPELLKNPEKNPEVIAEELDLFQEKDTDKIHDLIKEVLSDHPSKVAAYKKGKKGLLSMFMGEMMKRSKGKIDPKKASELLRRNLEN